MKLNLENLFKKAVNYGKRKGLNDDAEDFAQECLIKAFELGNINFEYIFKNYRDKHRANKRIVGNTNAVLGKGTSISISQPIGEDGTELGDFIGDQRNQFEFISECSDLAWYIQSIINLIENESSRKFAKNVYEKYLKDNL